MGPSSSDTRVSAAAGGAEGLTETEPPTVVNAGNMTALVLLPVFTAMAAPSGSIATPKLICGMPPLRPE